MVRESYRIREHWLRQDSTVWGLGRQVDHGIYGIYENNNLVIPKWRHGLGPCVGVFGMGVAA